MVGQFRFVLSGGPQVSYSFTHVRAVSRAPNAPRHPYIDGVTLPRWGKIGDQ